MKLERDLGGYDAGSDAIVRRLARLYLSAVRRQLGIPTPGGGDPTADSTADPTAASTADPAADSTAGSTADPGAAEPDHPGVKLLSLLEEVHHPEPPRRVLARERLSPVSSATSSGTTSGVWDATR